MRLCLSLRWATPSCVTLCICTLAPGCAAGQVPWADTELWLSSHIFWISLRGLRSTFVSDRFIRLQLLLFIACLHKVSSWKNKKKNLFITISLITEDNDNGKIIFGHLCVITFEALLPAYIDFYSSTSPSACSFKIHLTFHEHVRPSLKCSSVYSDWICYINFGVRKCRKKPVVYSKPKFSKVLCSLRFSHVKLEALNNFQCTASIIDAEFFWSPILPIVHLRHKTHVIWFTKIIFILTKSHKSRKKM